MTTTPDPQSTVADIAAAGIALDVAYNRRHGWTITATGDLTDEQAKGIVFRAEPQQVVMGDFVEVVDNGGTRIGVVSRADFMERWDGPSYVVVRITLR